MEFIDISQTPLIRRIIELTLAVYRVSDALPSDEPIRRQMRERANIIVAQTVRVFYFPRANPTIEDLFSEIDILRGYFSIARHQQWVKEANFELLESAYKGIKGEFKEYFSKIIGKVEDNKNGTAHLEKSNQKIDRKKKRSHNINSLTERQKKILEEIGKNGAARVGDLQNALSGVNSRTLRRDLQEMVHFGILRQETRGRKLYFVHPT